MSATIFQSSTDSNAGNAKVPTGTRQGLSARSTNIVGNNPAKKKNGKRKHAQTVPSYMRPTKSFAPKQQSKIVDQSDRKKIKMTKNKLTVPESPALRTGARSISRVQRAHARELQQQEREVAQRKLGKARHNTIMKRALLPKPITGAVRSDKSLTLPTEFHLETAERPRAMPKHNVLFNPGPIVAKTDTTTKLTQPIPFNLHTSARAKMQTTTNSVEPFKSTVQLMNEFHHKTPERYHSKPKIQEVPVLPSPANITLTIPMGPNFNASARETVRGKEFEPMCLKVAKFHTKTPERFRTVPAGSKPVLPSPVNASLTNGVAPCFKTDERAALKPKPMSSEDLAVQYMKENAFKANPVNYNALNSCGDLGVPKLVSKTSTVCEPFIISETNKPNTVQVEKTMPTFKAQPVNKDMLERPLFVPKPSGKVLTEARSPVFRTAVRAAAHTSTCAKDEEMNTDFVAKPMPNMTYPSFVPQPSAKPLTEAQPFRLASVEAHENYQAALKEKLAMDRNEEQRQRHFKARPVVLHFPQHALNPVAERPLTEVESFNFEGNAFSEEAKRSMQQLVELEQHAQAEAAEFKARPMPDLSKKFTVAPSDKELTTANAPELGTRQRAEQRAEFAEQNQERLIEENAQREEAERLRALEEEEDVKKLRKAMDFKAQPIFKGRMLHVKKSNKPLTVSQSPSFGSRSKGRRS